MQSFLHDNVSSLLKPNKLSFDFHDVDEDLTSVRQREGISPALSGCNRLGRPDLRRNIRRKSGISSQEMEWTGGGDTLLLWRDKGAA